MSQKTLFFGKKMKPCSYVARWATREDEYLILDAFNTTTIERGNQRREKEPGE